MNFLAISCEVVIDLGAKELNQSLATPLKENGNNGSLITSSDIGYYLYESQIATKFSNFMWGSSLGSQLNWPTDWSIWNVTGFRSKLFVKICGLTMLRLKSSNWGRANSANGLLWLTSSNRFWCPGLTWLPMFWFIKACSIGFCSTKFWLPMFRLTTTCSPMFWFPRFCWLKF